MENGDALYARIAELEEENTYTTVALLYGKKYNLKYWQCIGTGTNGKVTLPNMIALKKSCTCHVCGYLEEDIKQSDQLVCECDVCNLPLCDHCRATDDENEVVDDSICQDCYDNKDTGMTPEELQIDFWDNMGEMWGYDIIGSESHPLKKAFELYCEMKKEDEDE